MAESEKLNQSFQRLQCFDYEEKEGVEGSVARWFSAVMKSLKCINLDELTADKFMGPNKPVLSRWLAEARDLMSRQAEVMANA